MRSEIISCNTCRGIYPGRYLSCRGVGRKDDGIYCEFPGSRDTYHRRAILADSPGSFSQSATSFASQR